MNLNAFLAEAAAAGSAESRGAFTTSLEGMLERLAHNLLVDPSLIPLVTVAGAVGSGARRLDIRCGRKELAFHLEMDEPALPDSRDGTAALHGCSARPLLVAAAVWRRLASKVSLEFPGQQRRFQLTSRKTIFEPCAAAGQERVRLVVSGRVPRRQELEVLLLRHAGLCPIPLSLEGRELQSALDRAYGNALWSASVPAHLRPSGPPLLETSLPLLLAPADYPKPPWVAVVGGLSYPFLLPEAFGVQGIVWSEQLRTDLGLAGLAWDDAWSELRQELQRQASLAGMVKTSSVCPRCRSSPSQTGPCPALLELMPGRALAADSPQGESAMAGFNTAYRHGSCQVVVASDATDLVETVRYARRHGQRIAVQATGHGVHGPIRQEILLTTGQLSKVVVDPSARLARVGAGARWRDVYEAATPHGLTPVAGSSPLVGVVGYLLGGGLGPLVRSHGFGSDYLEELTVVTGDGCLRRASREQNADLFWALRGGKVGLGVVSEARVRLIQLPSEILLGRLVFIRDLDRALLAWLEWTSTAPEQVSTSVALTDHLLEIRFVYPGSPCDGTAYLAPLLALDPYANFVEAGPPSNLADLHGDPEEASDFWVSGLLLSQAGPDLALMLKESLSRYRLEGIEIRHLGGAASLDVPEGSAVGGRSARFSMGCVWKNERALFEHEHPLQEEMLRQDLRPWVCQETNINFAARIRDQDHFDSAWPPDTRHRLEQVRRRFDPDGVFAPLH